jgi:hypothetical protein
MVALASLILPGVPAAAGTTRPDLSGVRVMAVAPFGDEAVFSRPLADYGAARLSELLRRAGFQMVDVSRVADAMKRLGFGSRDLISPSRSVALGTEVGADAIITGRVTQLVTERDASTINDHPIGAITSRVDVDIRLINVGSRVNLFQDTFICDIPGFPANAMDCVVRDAAARLLGRD